ncbi:50S ribosomal protein L18 [Candidatus Acetothermia bacterium]|nr:50S ribosomal protein L18 [Candidatus Acetothermia bacterium]MBI3460994.1 50S ribosomal protein L18 [Candidatus Acetothermia bacterium]MBI3659196.1 50S ribosomal protein L18 [Candidatus Acetothermia bacterium]
MARPSHNEARQKRHRRLRKKLFGTPERPRLCVYKSLKHVHAQIINDLEGKTLVAASTLEKEITGVKGGTVKSAQVIGKVIAERAQQQGIKQVVFDRAGFPYHGVIKALADSSRAAGLKF